MAISAYPSFNLLDTWRTYVLEDIWHFNQVTGPGAPLNKSCPVYTQPERDVIARALGDAVMRIADTLNFYPVPAWIEEDVYLPRRLMDAYPATFRTRYGHVQALGARATELIQANAPVVYSQVNNPDVDDTATITVTTDVDASEAQLFFRVADGAYGDGHEYFQITPLRVERSGNDLVFTGHRALFVSPADIWDAPYLDDYRTPRNADTENAADFVTSVDVYRVYADSTQAVSFRYANPCPCAAPGSTTAGTGELTEARGGYIKVCPSPLTACRGPYDVVTLRYLAGVPYVYGKPDVQLTTAIVRLANSLMPRSICAKCDQKTNVYKDDMEREPDLVPALINNPFGIKKGEIAAWKIVQMRARGLGGRL